MVKQKKFIHSQVCEFMQHCVEHLELARLLCACNLRRAAVGIRFMHMLREQHSNPDCTRVSDDVVAASRHPGMLAQR